MKITFLNAKQVGVQLKRLMIEAKDFHWAVAWATEMSFANTLLDNQHKIRHLVIGTDFAQTSPTLLRKLIKVKTAHVIVSKGGITFHPKVFCFVDGKKISAIVGSANFTNGGTDRNDEAALLLEGGAEEKPLQEILQSISTWWNDGKEIEEEFLVAYELRWLANQKHRKALGKPIKTYRPTDKSENPKLLSTSWSNYMNKVKKAAPHGNVDLRIAVLKSARKLFDSVTSFKQLGALQRKAIAGFIGSNEILDTDLDGIDWGWFGSMKGAGDFKNRILENDEHLSLSLEHIPSIGEVTEDDYVQFAVEFRLAFKDSTNKGGVATASRLLAMKRPDYFVCVDSKNAKRLGADVGFAPSTLTLDNYWERVVEPITQARWWNENRPVGKDGSVWDARAAMLDVIYMD